MKTLFILSVIFMIAGCTAKKDHVRADAYKASPPSCSTHSDEIDCQWKNVPASWPRTILPRDIVSSSRLSSWGCKGALSPASSSRHSFSAISALKERRCRMPPAAIFRWLLHSSAGIRDNNPYHTLHIRDTAVKCLAGRAQQFALRLRSLVFEIGKNAR